MKRITKFIYLGFQSVALACFALSPAAHAQLPPPPPDGGYPGNNTAEGTNALFSLTTGTDNTATGFDALQQNTTGLSNTAIGSQALGFNTTGNENTANGWSALKSNTTGSDNTASGIFALESNTTGNSNTATGVTALFRNTTGSENTANGVSALDHNTTGSDNTANGANALAFNLSGSNNTATGINALRSNTIGHDNIGDGFQALLNNTGANNIAVGSNAGVNLTTGRNNIDIGNGGVAGESAKIRIGTLGTQNATFIAGISGVTVTGVGVVVSSSGQLGVAASSARFKQEIKPMDKASEAILALKPVTFRYKKELDPEGIPQFGLVAEDVEKVSPDLVVRDKNGEIYTVRYDQVNAMLLNEFLKEHRKGEQQDHKIQEQDATIAQLKSGMEALTATVKEQAGQIQKVGALLEASRPAPHVAENNQ